METNLAADIGPVVEIANLERYVACIGCAGNPNLRFQARSMMCAARTNWSIRRIHASEKFTSAVFAGSQLAISKERESSLATFASVLGSLPVRSHRLATVETPHQKPHSWLRKVYMPIGHQINNPLASPDPFIKKAVSTSLLSPLLEGHSHYFFFGGRNWCVGLPNTDSAASINVSDSVG